VIIFISRARTVLLFLSLFVSTFAFCQEKGQTIIIMDEVTNLPIEDVTVYIVKTKQTNVTNAEGKVSFVINGISNLKISHPSYLGITVRSSTLTMNPAILYLKTDTKVLEEIVVTKQHPQKVLKSIVENSIKTLTAPARLKVYTREFFKLNGTYSYYNDGLLNFQIFGKEKNFNTTILVEQNRSIGLVTEEVSADLLGYNLNNIMENYYNFNYLDILLDAKAKKDFEFVIKTFSQNKDYLKMMVSPLENAKGLLDDFVIIYDKKRKLIIEVSSSLSSTSLAHNKEKKAIGSKNIYKSMYKNSYRVDNGNYYLVSSKEEIGFEKVEKNKTSNIEVRNYFLTTNFSTQNYSFKPEEVFKDKTLHNKTNVILSDYWNVSGLTATEEEQQIIQMLQDKME
jgi:hypothetical protein